MDRLEATRYAGKVNIAAIELGFKYVVPGTTLLEIDNIIEDYLLSHNCQPVFKGYHGFPSTCCLSPNEVVVHGVPSNYNLKEGDILTIDLGCSHEGWMVDSARTRVIDPNKTGFFAYQARLISAVESVLSAEMGVIKDGVSLLEIAKAAETEAAKLNVNIFYQYGGHKIGRELHIEPFIPNAIDPSLSSIKRWQLERQYDQYKLHEGEIICLEPVTTFGSTDIIVDEDGWTVRSKDKSLVAHSEHCLLITKNGYEILS